jgi:signal transduction histidine kinase
MSFDADKTPVAIGMIEPALQDLVHQLRGPLLAAVARLGHLLERELDPHIERQIRAVRGLCRKASHIAGSSGLFALIHSGDAVLKIARKKLTSKSLLKSLIEIATDVETLIDPGRNIRIVVDRESLDKASSLYVDPALFQQAILNVLDNAAKYSFSDTTVAISSEFSSAGLCIVVSNTGLELRPEDEQRCLERGWRGPTAAAVTAEGTGIGLWIVRHIMEAHGGVVRATATTTDGRTKYTLAFPRSEDTP